jgi:drug/metabolite transporter (DMT)-like permease
MCLFAYYVYSYLSSFRSEYQPIETQETEESTLTTLDWKKSWLFLLPTLCDLTATTLMNVGLVYISASIYQMLRGSVVLFTGSLSAIFLNRRHPVYRWAALVTVFVGVAIVGLSGYVQSSATVGVPIKGSPVGIFFVILAQLFTAAQFVIEEKIMSSYKIPAIKAVGYEGLFGTIIMLCFIPMMHNILGVKMEPGNIFDAREGLRQIAMPQIFGPGIGIIFSIAFFNWFGLTVTRSISSTARSTIDTCRYNVVIQNNFNLDCQFGTPMGNLQVASDSRLCTVNLWNINV